VDCVVGTLQQYLSEIHHRSTCGLCVGNITAVRERDTPTEYRSILTSFFTVLPKGLTAGSYVHVALYQGVTNLWAVAHTRPLFFPPHPWKQWSLTSTANPTPLLYSFFSFSPQSKIDRTHRHTYFFQNKISKIFLGPFPGPQGLLPLIFEFPYSRCISSNFFRRFDLYFRFLLHGPSIHLLLGLVNICFRSKVQDYPNRRSYYSAVPERDTPTEYRYLTPSAGMPVGLS